MADNIANILMRIGGEDDGASDTLEAFFAKLKAFGKASATAEADISTGAGGSKLAALEAALKRFARQRATATADIEVESSGLDNLNASLKQSALQAKLTQQQLDRLNTDKLAGERREKLIVPVGVQSTQARREMARVLRELSAEAEASEIEVPLKIEGSLAELAKTQAAIRAFGAGTQGLKIQAAVDVDTDDATTKLALLAAKLRKFDQSEAVAKAKIEPTLGNLNQVFKRLTDEAGRKKLIVQSGIDTGGTVTEFQALLAKLQGMAQTRKPTVTPTVDLGEGLRELATWVTAVQAADRQKIDVDVDVNKVSLAGMVMAKLASTFASTGAAATRMGQSMGGVTVNLGMFGLKLTPMVGVVLALAVAMGVSLVGALSLLVTALAGATAAVGALAAAFIGALGPIVAIAVAAVTRITKVVEAIKAKNAAEKAGAAGSAQSIALEEKRHNALLAVGNAIRGVTTAQRGLAQAQKGARDAIVQANRDEQAAMEDLGLASQNVARTMQEGFKAIADAAEAARDAVLDLEQSKLGMEQAELSTRKAELALKEFRAEAGLAGAELSRSFDKFTDVDFQFEVGDIQDILKTKGGGKSSAAEAIELEERILAVRQAKLNEKKATDSLGDSERDLNEKRKEAAKYAREGIAAYEPYTAAVRAQRDATVRLADAQAKSNELDAAGVAGAPAVIAASEGLANAQRALTEARHDAARVGKEAAGGEAARKAKEDWDALTKAEQLFGLALESTATTLNTTFKGALQGVFGGLTSALLQLPAIMSPLEDAFTVLGEALGASIAGFANFLARPEMTKAFETLILGAAELVRILGGKGFQAFFEIMTNIAVAAMPLLIASMKLFVGWLERMAARTRDPEKLGHAMAGLGDHLFGVIELVKQIARVFVNFFKATSGESKGFVKTLSDMFKGMADFLGSTEGKTQIQDFFKAIIPLAIETMKFIGNAILIILQVVEAVAPALTGILKTFNLFLGIINRVLGVLKPFLKIGFQIALLFIGGLPRALGVFLSKFKLLAPMVRFLERELVRVVLAIIARISAIASFFPKAFDKVRTLILDFISWVGKRFRGVVDLITWPFREAIKFIVKLGGRFYEAGKGIITSIIEGMKSLLEDVGGIAGKVFKFLVDKLPGSEPKDKSSPLAGLAERGKAIMENIAKGVPLGADELSGAIHRSLVPVVAGIDTSVTLPRTKPPVGAGAGANGGAGTVMHNAFNIEAPAGALPDAEATAIALARRLERRAGGSPRQ